MRRNYGSLNLAALDLSSTSATVDHSGNCFHESLTHELANLEVVESDDCASIGFPMEHFAMAPDNDDAYARADAPRCRKRSLSEHGLDAEMRAAAASTSTCTSSSTATSSCIPITSALVSAAPVIKVASSSYTQPQYQHQIALDLPPRLVEQHHIELNALRCLSLKMMLSASSTSSSSSSSNSGKALVPQLSTSMPKVNSFEFDMGCLPQNDRVKTTLIAARRGSLPRNMIQSV